MASFGWIALACAASLTACVAPARVPKGARLFHAQALFHVEKPSFEGLVVGEKPEADYLAEKHPEQQESFAGDKEGMIESFYEGLDHEKKALRVGAPPGPGVYRVKVNVEWLEPGFNALFIWNHTRVRATVRVLNSNERVIDQFDVVGLGRADAFSFSSGGRLREAAESIGRATAQQLRNRAGLD